MANPAAKKEYYRRNFEAFCRRQLKISTPRPGELIPLTLNDSQKILLAKLDEQKRQLGYIRYCCCKSRQSTMSTFAQALCFHSTALTQQFNALLIANDEPTTADIFSMSSRFVTHMDADVRPMMDRSSVREVVFQNPDKRKRFDDPGLQSKITFQCATRITAGTGSTRHAVHLSELSKWNDDAIELLFSSIMPALHLVPGTIGIKESTPYVGGDAFREMCEDARAGKGDDVWHFIPWFADSKNAVPLMSGELLKLTLEEKRLQKLAAKGQPHDAVPSVEMTMAQFKWRRKKIDDLKSELMFAQEYPNTFEDGWIRLDSTIFAHDILALSKSDLTFPKRFVTVEPGPKILTHKLGDGRRDVLTNQDYCAIWKEPEPGEQYDIGADVSVGSRDANDWSVAEIFRRDTREQVAEIHLHIDPKDFGTLLYWIGVYYNNAHLIVEMNGPGFATHGQLSAMAYPNIYIWRHRERDVPTFSNYRGWKTQHDSKQLMVSNAMHRFNHREFIIHSRLLWQEMFNYVEISPGVYRASTGHDDAVTALMICNQGAEDESFGEEAKQAEKQSVENQHVDHGDVALQDDFGTGPRTPDYVERIIRESRGVC